MEALKIIFDVQHKGKPHNPDDRGAKSNGLVEADLCLDYALVAYRDLKASGHEPFLVTSGTYGQRAAFSNAINADLYLACHLNSFDPPPTNTYSLVEISEFSGQITKEFSSHLATIFANNLPVTKSLNWEIKKNGRGWSCINRVRAPTILLEPLFINDPRLHDHITKHMCTVGKSIASAVKTFDWGQR
jgi:N-acetylmuramoyl-L-alanine amidase